MKKTLFYISLAAVMLMTACGKDNDSEKATTNGDQQAKVYLLNEGKQGDNNASLSLVNIEEKTITNNYFQTVNGRPLGDVAQDIIQHGSKIYISVSESGTIEVIDAKSGKAIKQIDMGSRYPRYIAANGSKIYVSCYYPHSVVSIDTTTLEIGAVCTLSGLRPEGLCVADNKLYVCNSYDADESNNYSYDSTLSVIDLATFTESKRINIAYNPQQVIALADGRLAINFFGDYGLNPSGVAIYNIAEDKATLILGIPVAGMTANDNTIFTYGSDYDENWNAVPALNKIDLTTMLATPFVPEMIGDIKAPYGMAINPTNGEIYLTDAQNYTTNGDLYCITSEGTLRWKAETSLLPKKLCFVK